MDFSLQLFWIPLLKIIWINIVLSGDNAVVIALAARSLPPKQQKQAVAWGSGAAVAMRIVLTLFAVALLPLPYLKLLGAVLLLWIGVQLLLPEWRVIFLIQKMSEVLVGTMAGVNLWEEF